MTEYPASGGAISSHQFTTVKLLRYVTIGDYILMGCEFVFIAFVFYYVIEELIEVLHWLQPMVTASPTLVNNEPCVIDLPV